MKIKHVLIASALAFGLAFSVSDGTVMAKPDNMITFEEFVQDKAQYEKWEKEHIAHIKKIQELKDEKRIRRMEYKAFTHNPNAEPKLISKVAREIVMLDRQIKNLNQEFMDKTRKEYGVDFIGFEFHRDFTPCFKRHVDHFGHPRMMDGCPFVGADPRAFEPVPPHRMKGMPHHYKNMPPHEFYGDMPPVKEMPKPKKMKPEPEIDM